MQNFVDKITTDELYPNILLYQCNKEIGEKICKLGEEESLVNTYLIGLFGRKYNKLLIDKLGVKNYIDLINNITELEGGKISVDWVIKKSWLSNQYRKKVFDFIQNKGI